MTAIMTKSPAAAAKLRTLGFALAIVAVGSACSDQRPQATTTDNSAEEKVLNVYNWANYIGSTTVADFEAETGIKVSYDTYDANEILETKLLTGNTGYDIVVPAGNFFERLRITGALLKLDKSLLPNLSHMDAELMRFASGHDPGNQHGIPYLWGTTGIGFNPDLVEKAIGTRTVDSWRILFDPIVAAKLSGCGIAMLDAPEDVLEAARIYLGRDPNSTTTDDLAAAEALLHGVRPYVRYFHSSQYVNDLASGEICVALGWNGDVFLARARGAAASEPVIVNYSIPNESSSIWTTVMAVPADAPHPANAHAFLNFVMEPEVIARISNEIGSPNGNADAMPFVEHTLRNDPIVYPAAEVRSKLHLSRVKSQEFTRLQNRAWTRIKTGL